MILFRNIPQSSSRGAELYCKQKSQLPRKISELNLTEKGYESNDRILHCQYAMWRMTWRADGAAGCAEEGGDVGEKKLNDTLPFVMDIAIDRLVLRSLSPSLSFFAFK